MAASFGLSLLSMYSQSKMIDAQLKYKVKKDVYDNTQAQTFLFRSYTDKAKKRAAYAASSNVTMAGTPQLIEQDEDRILNEELETAVSSVAMRKSGYEYSARSQHMANAMNFMNTTSSLGMSLFILTSK